MKIKLALVLILVLNSAFISSYGMEKTTLEKHREFLAQQKEPSNFMRWINKIAGKYVLGDNPSKPAKPSHHEMWEKAQNALSIPEQYHAPIVAFDPEKVSLSIVNGTVRSATMNDKMYVNEEIDDFMDYSLHRFNHYHEAVHHKYLDALNTWKRKFLLSMPSVITGPLASVGLAYFSLQHIIKKIENSKTSSLLRKFPVTIAITGALTSFTGGIASTLLLEKYAIQPLINKNLKEYSQFKERRADLQASYAIKCHKCLKSKVNNAKKGSPKEEEISAESGYVSWKELEEIAMEHKRNGLVCDYHNK